MNRQIHLTGFKQNLKSDSQLVATPIKEFFFNFCIDVVSVFFVSQTRILAHQQIRVKFRAFMTRFFQTINLVINQFIRELFQFLDEAKYNSIVIVTFEKYNVFNVINHILFHKNLNKSFFDEYCVVEQAFPI